MYITLPIVLYGRESWSLTLQVVTGGWKLLQN